MILTQPRSPVSFPNRANWSKRGWWQLDVFILKKMATDSQTRKFTYFGLLQHFFLGARFAMKVDLLTFLVQQLNFPPIVHPDFLSVYWQIPVITLAASQWTVKLHELDIFWLWLCAKLLESFAQRKMILALYRHRPKKKKHNQKIASFIYREFGLPR